MLNNGARILARPCVVLDKRESCLHACFWKTAVPYSADAMHVSQRRFESDDGDSTGSALLSDGIDVLSPRWDHTQPRSAAQSQLMTKNHREAPITFTAGAAIPEEDEMSPATAGALRDEEDESSIREDTYDEAEDDEEEEDEPTEDSFANGGRIAAYNAVVPKADLPTEPQSYASQVRGGAPATTVWYNSEAPPPETGPYGLLIRQIRDARLAKWSSLDSMPVQNKSLLDDVVVAAELEGLREAAQSDVQALVDVALELWSAVLQKAEDFDRVQLENEELVAQKKNLETKIKVGQRKVSLCNPFSALGARDACRG